MSADPYVLVLTGWLRDATEHDQDRLFELIWSMLKPDEPTSQMMRSILAARLAVAIRTLEAIARNQIAGGHPEDDPTAAQAFSYRLLAAAALSMVVTEAQA